MKKCYKCKEEKPLTEFSPSKTGSQGVCGYCKQCKNKIRKERYVKKDKPEIKNDSFDDNTKKLLEEINELKREVEYDKKEIQKLRKRIKELEFERENYYG